MTEIVTKKQAAAAQNKVGLAALTFVLLGVPGLFLGQVGFSNLVDGHFSEAAALFIAMPVIAALCGLYVLKKGPVARELVKRYNEQQDS